MSEEYYKNRCIKLDKKLDRVIDSHTKLEDKMKDLQQRIDKAITLIQLIQMNDEIDWGYINTLIHILKGDKE